MGRVWAVWSRGEQLKQRGGCGGAAFGCCKSNVGAELRQLGGSVGAEHLMHLLTLASVPLSVPEIVCVGGVGQINKLINQRKIYKNRV